jgi:hypothetical protein
LIVARKRLPTPLRTAGCFRETGVWGIARIA